ncbi:MAG: phosphopantetheine-binding protein [Burkholderiaceae bacterium]|jgi:acyl carrier protein|nr:phosphopantetheine-binding protein [Burkholderiaceae bacterium]
MTTRSQVLDFIREIIEEVKDFDAEITDATTFDELELDSLDYVQTQIEAKKRFGVDLSPELFSSGKIINVGQLCTYIAEQASSESVAVSP